MESQAKKQDEKTLKNDFVVSSKIACNFFSISRETLSTWEKKGAPKEGRGKWDLKKLMEWRYKGEHMETPALRKLKAEADLKEAKAKQEKIKLNVTEGKFLPVSEVQAETSRLLADFKKNILAMGHHVATQLATVASPEATEIARNEIDKRIKEALEELSKHGRISGRKGKKGQKKTAL